MGFCPWILSIGSGFRIFSTTWAVARGKDVWLAATLWNLLGLCQAPLEHPRPLGCRQQGWCGVTIFQHGYDINGLEPTIDGYVTQLKSMAFPYLFWFATRQMSSAQNWSVFFLQVALPAIGMITCEQLSSTQHNEIKYTKNRRVSSLLVADVGSTRTVGSLPQFRVFLDAVVLPYYLGYPKFVNSLGTHCSWGSLHWYSIITGMSWGYSIHHRNIIIIPSIFHYTILIFYYKLCTSYAIYSLRWWGSLR